MRTLKKLLRVSLYVGTFLFVVYGVIPQSVSALKPQACRNWQNRLMRIERIPYIEVVNAANSTKVVVLSQRFDAAFPRSGLSVPGLVAVIDSPSLYSQVHLRWHEMVHQYQYQRDGIFIFVKNYALDYHNGLMRGCTFDAAYRSTGYEMEAEFTADSIMSQGVSYSLILDPVTVESSVLMPPENISPE